MIKPRLGFLGVGSVGRHRMNRIAKSGIAEVSMVFDVHPERLEEANQVVPHARIAKSYGEMLEADLEGIVIATPTALRSTQAIRALRNGKAVFCQKPLGRTYSETASVIETAQQQNLLLGMDLPYRYTLAMQCIKTLLAQGELGQIYSVDLAFHNAYGPNKEWTYDPALSGGGCIMNEGGHLLDLALWCLDFPRLESVGSRLFYCGKPFYPGSNQVEDYATAQLDLVTGAVVQLACSWKHSVGADCMISATFQGTHGGLSLRNVNGSFYDFLVERHRGSTSEILMRPPDNWTGKAIIEWAKRLASGASFHPDAGQLLQLAQTLDLLYREYQQYRVGHRMDRGA